MHDAQIHALGMHVAVNGLALSLRAAKSFEHHHATQQRKLERHGAARRRREALPPAI